MEPKNSLNFLGLSLPILQSTINDFLKKEVKFKGSSCKESAELLIPSLFENINTISYKVLFHKFQVLCKEGILNNDSDGLDKFFKEITNDEIRNYIFETYPILLKWIKNETNVWFNQSLELIDRYNRDFELISSCIGSYEFENIASLRLGLGDKHRGGQTVSVIVFQSGKKIVYKPRALAIDNHFSSLVNWISLYTKLSFKFPKIIDKGLYGWVEFIEHDPCLNPDQLPNYYERLGAYLGILYLLDATDFHYENVIASGEYPVMIDLETLFHPYFPIEGTETNQGIESSVLRSGILPRKFSFSEDEDSQRIDISGSTDVEGATGILANQVLVFNDRNGIELIREKGKLLGGKNIPLYDGKKILLGGEYVNNLKNGFETTIRFLIGQKEELYKKLELFNGDEIRVIFRDTLVYTHLLHESTHPSVLTSESSVNEHFNWLNLAVKDFPLAKRFIDFETKALWNRDVPLFTTKTNSRNLWYSDKDFLPNFFEKNALEYSREKIKNITEGDIERQLWVIDASFSLSQSLKNSTVRKRIEPDTHSIEVASADELLNESIEIADKIIKTMYQNDSTANWLVFKASTLDGKDYEVAESFYDLFTGMPGEILFLAYLSKKTGDSKYKIVAKKALKYLLLRITQAKESIKTLGIFAGWGSIIYLLTHLRVIWNDERFYTYIEEYFKEINFDELIRKDKNYALIKGSAGFMISCLNYFALSRSKTALLLAEKCANHLITNSIEDNDAMAWRIVSKYPLSGLGHGSSGFSLAFTKLYEATKDRKYLIFINKILNYEKSLFVSEMGNWKDLRDVITDQFKDKIHCSTSWAHGAPGIGLSRIEMIKSNYELRHLEADVKIAVDTTIKTGFTQFHSLTNGSFGNLELLVNYADYYKDEAMKKRYLSIASYLIRDIKCNGFGLGNNGIFSLGLMSGITGIGYQFLRMASPKETPSILSLSNPIQS